MSSQDSLIQGMAWNGDFRVIAARTTAAVEEARTRRDMSPVAAAALGRAMTGALLLARLLDKNVRNQYVTLRFDGGGPLGLVIAEASVSGAMRGYVANPLAEDEKVDVGAAVGSDGLLTVVRASPPAGKPYTSQVRLVSGEMAKDIAHYLAYSEQIATAVLLGVMTRPTGVTGAGGILIQAFPHTTEEAIATMEDRVRNAPPFSSLIDRMPIEDAVREILQGVEYKSLDRSFDVPVRFECSCSRERALSKFRFFSPQELGEMIHKDQGAEASCQFCGRSYQFTADDLLGVESNLET
jgi:molecular chaperone Hsp33